MGVIINIFLVSMFSYFLARTFWAFLYAQKVYFKGRNYSLKRLKFLVWVSSKLNDPLFFLAKMIFEDYESSKKYTGDPKLFFEYYEEQSQIEMEEIIKELEEKKTLFEYEKDLHGDRSFLEILIHGLFNGNFNDVVNYDLYFELDSKEKELADIKKGIKKQRRILINGS